MKIELKPDQIPQYTGDLPQLEKDHAALKKDAGHIRKTGSDVHSHFQGLSAFYKAPEAEQLFATTKPVQTRADAFADDLETVSSALSSYADEIRPLVPKLKALKRNAEAFIRNHKDDEDGDYDEDLIAEHNQIRDDITATVAAFWAAERTCYNKIVALWNGPKMVAGDGSKKEHQYGFNAEDIKNAKLPWGDPVEEKHHWYEVGHWVKSFVWDGLIVDGIWGTIKGLGTLVGFGGWDAMGQAWKGLAQLATGLAIVTIGGPAAAAFLTLPDDKLPSWLRDSRTAMKETGKALVAWDEWGKNPGRAAGAVTFNVVTTVLTGGAGGAAAGAGKAGAVAKALSVAGKAGKVIDPMTYVAKGAGASLSKIGDIAKSLRGIGKIDMPPLPENAIELPEGAMALPDGTVHLPEGSAIPKGAIELPDGAVKLPEGSVPLPEGTVKLTDFDGNTVYADPKGNLYDDTGTLKQHHTDAPSDIVDSTPHSPADANTPHVEAPTNDRVLVGAGATHTADNAAHVRLGDSLDTQLGDTSRIGDDAATPGGHVGDPPGHGPGHAPGGMAGHLPDGHANDLGHTPSASHEPPTGSGGHTGAHGDGPTSARGDGPGGGSGHGGSGGPHAPTPPRHSDSTPGNHADDGIHHASDDGPGHSHEPHTGRTDHNEVPTDDSLPHHGDAVDGPDSGPSHDTADGPQGTSLEPQPDWHGQSADQMRHYRRPALDVSHLTPEERLTVLEREAVELADEARKAPAGEALPGQNHLDTGCAGSFLHDNVITVHTSTTKMHGQTLPHTHKVLDDMLQKIADDAKAGVIEKKGSGHGKCAEISLISDRLRQLDPTGTQVRTIDDARRVFDGSVMHTRRIGDFVIKKTGEVRNRHGDYFPPCDTCKHILPQLGIRAHE
ncbi:YwqJ-related putative deaminase [Streptomyces sp. NPDC042319]|uniref:YwqJ-related putative deaminase n=1 Tax=Streptomyces sp. NPDC042319 TaxID=3154332 RepID=UPI0033FA8CE5